MPRRRFLACVTSNAGTDDNGNFSQRWTAPFSVLRSNNLRPPHFGNGALVRFRHILRMSGFLPIVESNEGKI